VGSNDGGGGGGGGDFHVAKFSLGLLENNSDER